MYHQSMERIIINLRHIPTYDKFVKFITEALQRFTEEDEVKLGELDSLIRYRLQELADIDDTIRETRIQLALEMQMKKETIDGTEV